MHKNLRFALTTAGIIAAVGGVSVAAACSGPHQSKPVADLAGFGANSGYTKNQCKDGGWKALGYKNQGQCVSFFAHKHDNDNHKDDGHKGNDNNKQGGHGHGDGDNDGDDN